MKTHLVLATCLIFVGCSRQEENKREVTGKPEPIKSDLTNRRGESARWAFANKREIESVIFQASMARMAEAKKTEALPPDVEEKIRQYEALQAELSRKRMEAMRSRFPTMASNPPATDKEIEALSQSVAAAKAPIADIIDRRNQQMSQYREQHTPELLVEEYVKGRFDLVVDSSDERFSRSAVLYRASGEVLDITDGVIKLFKEKTKQ